jgi:uncharacterized membrane protein YjgN (DUF898 family)
MTDIRIDAQDEWVSEVTGPATAETPIDLTMSFMGRPVDYLLILLKTTFFIIITFGLYYPWARAERLRYLMNHTKLGPHAFSFNGTGQEIALSYFKGLFVYGLIYAGMIYGSRLTLETPVLGMAISVVFTSLFYGLLPLVIWGGKAYRLSRTRYRSIYFSVERRMRNAFLKRYFLDLMFTIFSLGFYGPVLIYNMQKNLTQATRWGNVPFQYTAQLSNSYWLSIQNFLLSVITLGLYMPFAFARRFNFNANHTRVGDQALLRSQITAGDVVVLVVVPLLLTTVTLGLAYPWVTVWARQRMLQRISVIGRMDFTGVRQNKDLASANGETMSDLWGVDMSMGV